MIDDPEDRRFDTPRIGKSLGAPETLDHLRKKMESVAADFAAGKINRAQFNAIYGHYNEQRQLVDRLHQRNPDSEVWRHAASPGHTGFLRTHFEAHPVYYIVFRHRDPHPLIVGGQEPSEAGRQIGSIIKAIWKMDEIPPAGLARKAIGNGQWVLVALGEFALSVVIYSLQPASYQQTLVRDLHRDFEKANRMTLQRGFSADKMVFPQRSLIH